MTTVSVIIVNYRGWRHLNTCLDSLSKINADIYQLETIVIDNFSNDGKLDEFQRRFPTVRFIQNTGNNGFSNGCNLGVAHANGDYLLFMNSDIIANAEAIWGMVDTIERDPGITLLSCSQQNSSGRKEHPYGLFPDLLTLNGLPRAFYKMAKGSELKDRFQAEKELIYPDWVSGSVMMISADNFRKTNGWCDDYWLYYEDVEFCWNVREIGGEVALTRQFSMIHNHGGATRINPRTTALTKAEVRISKHVFVSRHFSGLKAFLMHFMTAAGFLIGNLFVALLSLPLFFVPKLNAYGRLYLNVLSNYISAIRYRTWVSPRSVNYQKYSE
ncbi:glycosyltransferase [Mangrovibacterium lignilyticum]|uniref:glycosyltransferase n=1 Tax=Mangrovibacterium lignilyticum TaxID=2668052 RepID=UPI0013D03C98|nr:glycosyltransferase family 2 protein [Mangrovibacterium lignilyticum]